MTAAELREGQRVRLPSGVVATVTESQLDGAICELVNGWACYVVLHAGDILRVDLAGRGKRSAPAFVDTDWHVDDVDAI